MSRFQKILLVVNPVAGLARGARVAEGLGKRLRAAGGECTVRLTTGPGDACRWANEAGQEGFDLVVAIGGDGTLQEVAAGMVTAGCRIPIGHVPVGTANVVALALSLPWPTKMAFDVLSSGSIVPFDVGYLPGLDRHFILMAALGYPARIIQDSPRRLKRFLGFLAYVSAGLRNLFKEDQARLEITTESGTYSIEGNTVMVTNIGRFRDLGLRISPETSPHDGKFDVVVVSSRSLLDLIRVLLRILTWRYRPTQRLTHFQARRVHIQAEPDVPLQIDGEVIGTTPLVAEIIANGIEMIVPKRYAAP
jgi:YegS/Rv2252/BmrU family lipid kinase